MRSQFLVCYDVSDPKRLRKIYRKMHGFGTPLQYSVFLCALTPTEKVLLRAMIGEVINHHDDRVLVADLGPADGRGAGCFEFFGKSFRPPESGPVVV